MAMQSQDKIFVAGHRGMVGSAIVRCLQKQGFTNIILLDRRVLNLTDQQQVRNFMSAEQPDYIFLAAAKVGGIYANSAYAAEFIYDNLVIQTNVIDAAYRSRVKKLLFLGSSCIYPKNAPQPMPEDCLLSSELEPSNAWYAIAKIAGLKMCQAYRKQYGFDAICVMPTNLYGPGDNFNLQNSHVLPAMMRKFHEAKIAGQGTVEIWGSGKPKREFLHVEDLADACVFLMQNYSAEKLVNIGVGKDLSIMELARLIADIVDFTGDIVCNESKPDGTMKKLLDVSYLERLGWKARIGLHEGIVQTYKWYLDNESLCGT